MPRPESHREQRHDRSCGNCKYAHLVAYKLDLLCFYGDNILVMGQSKYPVDADFIQMDGQLVWRMEGDEYTKAWAGRVVDSDDVCDCFQPDA